MKQIVIIPNSHKDIDFVVTDKVADKLIGMGCTVYVNRDFGYNNSKVHIYDSFPKGIDLIIVVGGDGSVIDASGVAIERGIPLLGVNLGKVGYLAEVEVGNLELLEKLLSKDYSIVDKMLLDVQFDGAEIPCERYAVNDVAISRDSLEHMADIGVEDALGNAIKFRADGVILATPQGSTAYSFSSGGPVIAHDVESVLLTPVSPHSFFNRSVIFNSSDVITITNAGDLSLNVFVDGRCVGSLSAGKSCKVSKAEKNFRVLTFTRNSMFSSLFKKMRILGDID
jgi:NAD+ kinase